MSSDTFTSFAVSHTGKVRELNEDAFTCRDDLGLWAVADGLGGHEAGEVASRMVIRALDELEANENLADKLTRTCGALHQANAVLTARSEAFTSDRRPGSTVAVLLVHDSQGAVVWAGDSRIYRIRDGRVTQLTHDHSHVQDLVDRGELEPEEAESHPMAHLITRAVGIREVLNLESYVFDVHSKDRFLLCTDGLSRLLSAEEIGEFSLGEDPEEWLRAMLDVTLELGAPDNVTMIAVDVP